MSPPGARNAPGEEGASQNIGTARPDSRKPTRRHSPTQYQRVLRVLVERDEVCGHRVFYSEMAIPRFSAHLHRARREGMVITKRPCDRHDHEGTAYLYRLEAIPRAEDGEPCPTCGGILAHVSWCRARERRPTGGSL